MISLTAADTDSLLAVHALLAGQGEPKISIVEGDPDLDLTVLVTGTWPGGQKARVACCYPTGAGAGAAVTAMWRDGVARATAAEVEVAPVVWRVTEAPQFSEAAGGMRYRLHDGEWQVHLDGWAKSGWDSLGDMAAAGYRLVEDRGPDDPADLRGPATPGQDGDGRG